MINKNLTDYRALLNILLILSVIVLFLFPEIAFAQSNPIKKGTESVLGWITEARVPIATLIIIVGALGAWRNAWTWYGFLWAIVICFIIFFAETLVTTISGWATG